MKKIHETLKIKDLELKNRLVLPPMATAKSEDEGFVTDELCAYYDSVTRGESVGLVIAEHAFICMQGKAGRNQLSIAQDEAIAGLKKLMETMHANSTPVFAQINHAGMAARSEITGMRPMGPCARADAGKNVRRRSGRDDQGGHCADGARFCRRRPACEKGGI